MSDYDDMFKSISVLAEQLQALNQQAVLAYTPIVDDILRSRSRDTNHIEHTLDGLLSFCGYEPALQLYKKICRHYFFINSVATAEYINAYREMWDSEDAEDQPKPAKKLSPGRRAVKHRLRKAASSRRTPNEKSNALHL